MAAIDIDPLTRAQTEGGGPRAEAAPRGGEPLGFTAMLTKLHALLDGAAPVEIEEVLPTLGRYQSSERDWAQYVHFDDLKYTRNLVDDGNGLFNVLILCWSAGQESPIHDHADAHCFVKVLAGNLREELFPPPAKVVAGQPLECTRNCVAGPDAACYINDSIGMHRMSNPSHTDGTVTMHIYCPPYQQCHVFDERTSHSQDSCKLSFCSRFGTVMQSACH